MSDPAARRGRFVAAFAQTFGDRRLKVAQLQVDSSTGEQKAAWIRILHDLVAAPEHVCASSDVARSVSS